MMEGNEGIMNSPIAKALGWVKRAATRSSGPPAVSTRTPVSPTGILQSGGRYSDPIPTSNSPLVEPLVEISRTESKGINSQVLVSTPDEGGTSNTKDKRPRGNTNKKSSKT